MTSSRFFLSTLNYDARSTRHQSPTLHVSLILVYVYQWLTQTLCAYNFCRHFTVFVILLCNGQLVSVYIHLDVFAKCKQIVAVRIERTTFSSHLRYPRHYASLLKLRRQYILPKYLALDRGRERVRGGGVHDYHASGHPGNWILYGFNRNVHAFSMELGLCQSCAPTIWRRPITFW